MDPEISKSTTIASAGSLVMTASIFPVTTISTFYDPVAPPIILKLTPTSPPVITSNIL